MTYRLVPDPLAPKTDFLPFPAGQLDRSGLRLTRAEFSRFLGVSRQSVGEWVTSGKITLGADGRLDPRQAVSQLLRNSDPARLRARVLAPLVQSVGDLQKRIAELEVALASAKEDAEFHEGAAAELIEQQNSLRCRLQDERADMASLPGCKVADAIAAWLDRIAEENFDPDLPLLDCLPVSESEMVEIEASGAAGEVEGGGG